MWKNVLYLMKNFIRYVKEMEKKSVMIVVFMKIMRNIILHILIKNLEGVKNNNTLRRKGGKQDENSRLRYV